MAKGTTKSVSSALFPAYPPQVMEQPPSARRICVTGASGFLGSHVVFALLNAGFTVHGTLRASKHAERHRAALRAMHPSAPANLHFFEADLLEPGSFDAAVAGCDVVLHTACPVRQVASDPITQLIDPAVRGTENVLRACLKTPSVKTVVYTSSWTAVVGALTNVEGKVYTEKDWNKDVDIAAEPYATGKALAEEFAWRFVKQEKVHFRFVVLNPTYLIGPVLFNRLPVSISVIYDILKGQMCPQLYFPFVDVRDVAQAHIIAFQNPKAPPRTLLNSGSMWWWEWCAVLAARYPKYPISQAIMPNWIGYLVGLTHPRVGFMWCWRRLGIKFIIDASLSEHELRIRYTPPHQTLYDSAESLITRGMIAAPSPVREVIYRAFRSVLFAALLWYLLRRRVLRWLIR